MIRSKQGFTLIELLVYIVIAAIVVGLAGQAFVDSARSKLRTTGLLEASMMTSDVVDYLQEDIRRMGSKTWMQAASSSSGASSSSAEFLSKLAAVYWDPDNANATLRDSSSFGFATSGSGSHRLDKIDFLTGVYDSDGKLEHYEKIRYHVENGVLWRVVVMQKDLSGTNIAPLPDSVRIAENVVAFRLRYGVRALSDTLLNSILVEPCPATAATDSSCLVLHSGSATLAASSGKPMISNMMGAMSIFKLMKTGSSAETFAVKPGYSYKVEFGVQSNEAAATFFRPDRDYAAVTVAPADAAGSVLQDIPPALYYSAMNTAESERSFEFSAKSSASATLAFKFQFRSSSSAAATSSSSSAASLADAAFTLTKVRVLQNARNAYEWFDSFDVSNADDVARKARVKAIEMTISVQGKAAISTTTKVIPVQNNGV